MKHIFAAVLTLSSLALSAQAGMIGTTVSFHVENTDLSGTHVGFSLPSAVVTDPGVEFSVPGATIDFTDTSMMFHLDMSDWHTDVLSLVWTTDTPGAFAGLTVTTNTFPLPNANNAVSGSFPVFTNDGTTIRFSCCELNTTYTTADFTLQLDGATPSVPEPGTVTLLAAGLLCAVAGRRLKA